MLYTVADCTRNVRAQVGEVSEGELFRVETIDWTGGQIADNDCADDIKHVDLTQVKDIDSRSGRWQQQQQQLSQHLPGWQAWAEQYQAWHCRGKQHIGWQQQYQRQQHLHISEDGQLYTAAAAAVMYHGMQMGLTPHICVCSCRFTTCQAPSGSLMLMECLRSQVGRTS